MSTILDALKKVEQERDPALNAEQQRQLNAIQPATRNNRFGFGRRLINSAVLGVVLCLLAGAALLWYLGAPESSNPQKIDHSQGGTTLAERQTSAASDNDGGKKSVSSESPRFQTPKVARQQRRTESLPRITAAESVPAEPQPFRSGGPNQNRTSSNNVPNSQTTSSPEPLPVPANGIPAKRPAAPQLPSPQNEQRPDPAASLPLQTTPTGGSSGNASFGVLDRLADGSLKVQAIAWSPITDERMAVINSKIVREGNSVDDYTIVTIGQNEVVVRKGGQMWRAEFGRP